MTDLPTLLDWVLDHRHEHQNTQLMDLLDLARMRARGEIGPDVVIQSSTLEAHWAVSRGATGIRLNRLRDAGLIAYDPGTPHRPGYRIWRVGPPSTAM